MADITAYCPYCKCTVYVQSVSIHVDGSVYLTHYEDPRMGKRLDSGHTWKVGEMKGGKPVWREE